MFKGQLYVALALKVSDRKNVIALRGTLREDKKSRGDFKFESEKMVTHVI